MGNKNKTLAQKITIELVLSTLAIVTTVAIIAAFALKGTLVKYGLYKIILISVIISFSIGYVTYRIIESYIAPVKSLTAKLLDFKLEKESELSLKGIDTVEIMNLYKALSIMKENYKDYQNNLREEVWRRTMELEDYKNHLEQMVEDQIKDIRLAKLEAERANMAKTDFLTNMSHEFRTPMHAIISFSSLGLEKGYEIKPEKAIKYFESINSSGKRLMNLLNDLLDLSKLESGMMAMKFEKTDFLFSVDQVINEVLSLLANKNVQIKSSIFSNDTIISHDPARITQVVMNLFSNAIKFSPENSYINYEVSDHSENNKNYIKFTITDAGPGIPKDELDKVFDKFVQSSKTNTGAGGTGLGLSICKIILENHNGRIWAEDNGANGAKFSFILPKKA